MTFLRTYAQLMYSLPKSRKPLTIKNKGIDTTAESYKTSAIPIELSLTKECVQCRLITPNIATIFIKSIEKSRSFIICVFIIPIQQLRHIYDLPTPLPIFCILIFDNPHAIKRNVKHL